jgi:hypothetical protein
MKGLSGWTDPPAATVLCLAEFYSSYYRSKQKMRSWLVFGTLGWKTRVEPDSCIFAYLEPTLGISIAPKNAETETALL